MTCPLADHGREWLEWTDGDYKKGSVPHGDPRVSFRISPTYVLNDVRENFISGLDLVEAMAGGLWGKAETHRLGNENSEDALSWNVFRSLQEANLLSLVTPLLCDCDSSAEPDLFLWGRRITARSAEDWDELLAVRDELEPTHRQQTEPDVVLHLDGWGWVFIEAKFGSPITTASSAERMRAWLDRYPPKVPSLFALDRISGLSHAEFPEQLLRNVVFANQIAEPGERAHVVLLTREKDVTPVDTWIRNCLSDACETTFSRLTWEAVYQSLPDDPALGLLRRYFESKSYGLRQAFALNG